MLYLLISGWMVFNEFKLDKINRTVGHDLNVMTIQRIFHRFNIYALALEKEMLIF